MRFRHQGDSDFSASNEVRAAVDKDDNDLLFEPRSAERTEQITIVNLPFLWEQHSILSGTHAIHGYRYR